MRYFAALSKSFLKAFTPAPPQRDRMLVEAIEPRILHSADINPLQLVDHGSGAVAEMRYLDADGEFIQDVTADQQEQPRAIIFVDAGTPDYQQLIDQITSESDRPDAFEVVLIEPESDGLEQITSVLSTRGDLSAVHIISHGSDAEVQLGQGVLDADSLSQNAEQIARWGDALTSDADLLIYGCDVARSDAGRALVDALARLTGADVAASEDLTGNALLGGDWELEYRTGDIEAEVVLDDATQGDWLHVLPKITITARETVDADADGMIDHIKITTGTTNLNDDFSDIAITVAGYALDAVTPFVTDLDGSGAGDGIFFVKLQESGTPDTGATPTVEVTANSKLKDAKDKVGTDAAPVVSTDKAAPVLISAEANVSDGQSLFSTGDSLSLTFSETLSAAPTEAQLEAALLFTDLVIDGDNLPGIGAGANPIALTTSNVANDTITITFNINNVGNADALLVATDTVAVINGANITDGAGNTASTDANDVTIFGTPNIAERTTHDADGNGQIDRIELTLSQAIDDSTANAAHFVVAGYTVTGVDTGAIANDTQLFLLLAESGSTDTGATPGVTYTQGTLATLSDSTLIASDASAVTPTDGVAPRLVAKETADLNSDGYIDAIRLTFSEAINDLSFSASDWDVAGVSGEAFDTGAIVNDASVYITFTDGMLDTAATPAVSYTQDSPVDADVQDLAGNVLAGEDAAGWWDSQWLKRSKLTFDNSSQSETLIDFAVLVSINATDLPGLDLGAVAGADVRFVDGDGTQLKYEVETWDAATDTATVWVKVPQIDGSSSSDFIWVYYDYDGVATYDQSAADEAAVWNSEYVGLWHLNEGTGVNAADSTANANDATPVSGPTASSGQIGGALTFTAGDQLDIAAVTELDLTTYSDWTLSAWIRPTDYTGLRWPIIYSYGFYDASLGVSTVAQVGTDGLVEHWINDAVSKRGTTAATLNDWNHVAISRDSATGTTTLFLNGVDVGTVANTAITDSGQTSHIGGHSGDIRYQFLGQIDEVRVSGGNSDSASRSADWVRAEYLSASGSFAAFSAIDHLPIDTIDKAAPVLMSVETADTNSDGFINAVRLIYSEAIDDATVNAADWDVAGVTGEAFFTGAVANDDNFYIIFSDGVLDTGATPDVTYTQNATADVVGNLAAGISASSVDKAAPVLLRVTGFDAGTTNVFGDVGDVLELVFSETIAAAPTEADSETNFVFVGVDGDNFPTEFGGDTIIERMTTSLANDTIRYTFSAGDTASTNIIIPGTTTIDVNVGGVIANSIEDVAGNDLIDTVTGAALTILWRVGPVRDNDAAANFVAENSAGGATVGITAFADDPNIGENVTYALTDTAGGRFTIDSTTGVVTTDGTGPGFNFEAANSHDITVRATSDDGSTSEQTFTISVSDVNEAPTTLTITANAIDENVAANSVVGNFNSAGDPDTTAQTYTYTLVTGAGDTDNASFTIVGDALQINASPDFETQASYDIRVRTTDQGGLFTEQSFTVNVNDLNEAPTVSLANAVTELAQNVDTTARIKVADIVVADDALGVNVLSLVGADATMFEIDTGELYLKAGETLSNATNPVLDVTVEINDAALPATPEDSAALAITVTPDNARPTVSLANFTTTFPEDTDTTTRIKVADIVITDDGFGTNVLSLVGADAALFEIDGTELFLKAGTSLDFETRPLLDVTVEVNDPFLPATPADSGATWWDADWLNRRQISFDNSAASGNLTDFPVLVRLTAADVDFDKIKAGGADIRFVDAGGAALAYEIDSWDDVGETAAVWVRVPLISAGSTTDYIHMYYNNAVASDAQNPGAVWPTGVGFYHMDDDPGLSLTEDVKDSDATPNHGTLPTWFSSSDLVSGQIGKAIYFDGTNDYVDFASANVTNTFTISAWIKPSSSAGDGIQTIVTNSSQGASTDGWRFFVNSSGTSDGKIIFETGNGTSGNSASTGAGVINFDQWNHVSVVVDRTTGAAAIYHDGVDVTADSTIRTDFNTSSDWQIGSMEGTTLEFDGVIDEVRIASAAHSADWVEASYLSQNGTFAFNRFGGEGMAVTVTDVNEAPDAINDPNALNGLEDTTSGVLNATLLANDLDVDGDALSITHIDGTLLTGGVQTIAVTNGTVNVDVSDNITFTPDANYVGAVSLSYTVSDGVLTDMATAGGTITNVNDAPVAVDDAYATNEDTALSAVLGIDDVLQNDSDLDGDSLTVNTTPVVGVSNGTLVLNADGTFTYTPNANFNGSDSFTYEVSDGNGGTAQATVTITVNAVNDAPVGLPAITGTPSQDQILRADTSGIGDADGLGAFNFQWLRDGVAIGGATASTYTLGSADVGSQISVRVSYTDGNGTAEGPLTSAETAPVAISGLPVVGAPTIIITATSENQVPGVPTVVDSSEIELEMKTDEGTVMSTDSAIDDGAVYLGFDPNIGLVDGRSNEVNPFVDSSDLTSDDVDTWRTHQKRAIEWLISQSLVFEGQNLESTGIVADVSSGLDMFGGGLLEETADSGSDSEVISTGMQFASVALTVGAVGWAIRAGGLLTSLLVGMPIWREFDPLPVVAEDKEEKHAIEEADEDSSGEEESAAYLLEAGKAEEGVRK